jgi:DNA polymerase-4
MKFNMKILCVLLSHFPLKFELQRHAEVKDRPAVITCTAGSQKLVFDHSPSLEGLQPDMLLQEALSKYGDVELFEADIRCYWEAFAEILDALEQKSPLVEGSELGLAYLGVDGLQLIYPDDEALVKAVLEAIPAVFVPQVGLGEGKFLAYLAALRSPTGSYYKLDGRIEDLLRDLSCDVLPVSLKSKSKLHEFGLYKLGQVAVLPPGPLQSQFGPEGKRIWELARGYDETPLYPRCTEETIEESTVLSSVTVSLEVMLVTWESLLSQAFNTFSAKGMGVSSIILWTRSWTAGYWEQGIRFKEPAMEIKNVMLRIKQMLENTIQTGPVEQLGINITGLGRQSGRQKSLFAEVRAKDHLLEDIKQLEMRLGSPQVFQIKEVEPWSRIPERRYVLRPLNQ